MINNIDFHLKISKDSLDKIINVCSYVYTDEGVLTHRPREFGLVNLCRTLLPESFKIKKHNDPNTLRPGIDLLSQLLPECDYQQIIDMYNFCSDKVSSRYTLCQMLVTRGHVPIHNHGTRKDVITTTFCVNVNSTNTSKVVFDDYEIKLDKNVVFQFHNYKNHGVINENNDYMIFMFFEDWSNDDKCI